MAVRGTPPPFEPDPDIVTFLERDPRKDPKRIWREEGSVRLPRIPALAWLGWLLATLVVFAGLEGVALWNSAPNDSLTRTIVSYVPWPIALVLWAALSSLAFWHWHTEYRKRSGK